ncbi:DNA-packaging protein [Spirosoma daeguense]
MAAPAGNQFWKLRSEHGRDKLFETPEKLWEAACEYFQWCDDNPWIKVEQLKKPSAEYDKDGNFVKMHVIAELPTARPYTLKGLCLYCDASEQFWRTFKASSASEDFLAVIIRIEEVIYTQKFEGAAVGAFNPNLIARDLGLADKKEHSGKLSIEQITGMRVVSSDKPQ